MWQPVIFIVQWCPLFQETSSPKILIFFLNTAYEYLHLLVIPDDGVGDIIWIRNSSHNDTAECPSRYHYIV